MSELFDLLKNRLDPDMLGAIAGRLGLGGDETGTAVSTALPALLGGMAHHAQTDDGASGLLDQVDATAGGGMLDGLLDKLRGPAGDEDAGHEELFGGMLGGGILDALIGRLGIGGPVVKKLLGMLGPLVIGSLGKIAGGSRLSPSRLISLLTGAAGASADAAPGGRSGLASLLGPIAGLIGLGGGAAATVDKVAGSVGNVVDTVAEREYASPGAGAHAHGGATTGVAPLGPEDPMRRRGALGWVLGAAVVAALLAAIFGAKSCGDDKKDAATGTPTQTQTTTPTPTPAAGGYSIMDTGSGKVTLRGTVPSEDARDAAVTSATKVFGEGNVTDQLTIDTTAVTGPSADALGAVLTALKGAGSGWMADVSGTDSLTLTGEVASNAIKASIVKAATDAFTPGTVVDKLTVAAASGEDKSAVDAINKEITLRGVTFVTGSATLTGPGKATLDRVAKLLDDAEDVRAEVQGHTDSQGDAAANLALSSARAKAVVAYLVGKGIDAGRLVAKGYGETKPIASNDTDTGRAKNRRVVFSVAK